MKPVYLVSPWRGNTIRNLKYAMACMKDCLNRGESPLASHLLFTQCLNDWQDEERDLGIEAGQAWLQYADCCVVYADYGISEGMHNDIEEAQNACIPVVFRYLITNPSSSLAV